jgi:CheY-like chemotaxis protein
LIEDIIDISKIEAGQLKINKRPFVLNSLMDQLYSIFSVNPVFQKKNAARDIVLKYDKPCENITIISDPDRLKQIFVNLIGNALKFTQEGYVHFGYLIENDEIIFYVKDSGIGIPKSQTGKIFERFMQIDTTLSRKYGGSGLGLAISHGLISLLNGKIWCISDLGKGSNFFFTIPCQSVPPLKNTETPHKKDSTVHDWSDYTALIVEDDVINFKVIEAMLRATKVNIIHAEDGLKAIEQARLNTRIDIVLMDVHIPEINGLEASSKILEFRPELPIIAQTANAMSDDRDKCIEAGCVDYISKPINMNDLFARMSKFLPDRE